MTKNDALLARIKDIPLAIALLSRLPVGASDMSRSARAAWAYPLVGLLLGGIAALAGAITLWLGLPTNLAALVALACLVITTGAMHEDGLADTADGFWGGWEPARRLEIMKDSHIGTYGVIALILSLLARWAALWFLYLSGPMAAAAALMASAALSRATMPALMASLPHARNTGLSHGVGVVPAQAAWVAAGIALGLAILLAGGGGIWAALWATATVFGIAAVARAKIGGQTGDVLGASQQITEIVVLFSLLV